MRLSFCVRARGEEEAEKIALHLLEERVAACVNVVPVRPQLLLVAGRD